MMSKFFAKMSDEKGQGLVEYALIIVLVSLVAMAGLTILGGGIDNVFTTINNILAG
jgi:pilus assembly protein Flp/PilA